MLFYTNNTDLSYYYSDYKYFDNNSKNSHNDTI